MKGSSVFLCAVFILAGTFSANALTITPTGVTASSTQGSYDADDLINNSGLVGERHNTVRTDMWLSSAINDPSGLPTLIFDLGADHFLESADIWQFNDAGFTNRGVKEFEIYSSLNNTNYTLVTGATLAQSPGGNIPADNVLFPTTVEARWIRFDILSNIGSSSGTVPFVGLSEVKFNTPNAVPEPATLLLLGVGLVGLAGFGRKKLIKYK